MNKGIVAALAISGALAIGPVDALAAQPVVPQHAGHDHGTEPSKPAPKPDKPKGEKKGSHKGDGGHHNGNQNNDGAHAGGGYDAHRSHDAP